MRGSSLTTGAGLGAGAGRIGPGTYGGLAFALLGDVLAVVVAAALVLSPRGALASGVSFVASAAGFRPAEAAFPRGRLSRRSSRRSLRDPRSLPLRADPARSPSRPRTDLRLLLSSRLRSRRTSTPSRLALLRRLLKGQREPRPEAAERFSVAPPVPDAALGCGAGAARLAVPVEDGDGFGWVLLDLPKPNHLLPDDVLGLPAADFPAGERVAVEPAPGLLTVEANFDLPVDVEGRPAAPGCLPPVAVVDDGEPFLDEVIRPTAP